MSRAPLVLCACMLLGCQAVSGLDNLLLVGMDASAQVAEPEPGEAELGTTCNTEDECGAGNACVAGMCARVCQSDTDCKAGPCRAQANSAGEMVDACLIECDFASQRPCAPSVQCARFDEASPVGAGDYCVVPTASCETDGRCDEPSWGTRRCAAGSDARDCVCAPSLMSAACDLVSQCGCAPGTHCALLDVMESTASVACVADRNPSREAGALCNDESECAPGHSCWRGLCEKYCVRDEDCSGGRCIAVRAPNEVESVRVCTIACDFDANTGCASGSACVRAPDGTQYCLIPRSPCPFENDGVCDEALGTRICVDGSDAADCP